MTTTFNWIVDQCRYSSIAFLVGNQVVISGQTIAKQQISTQVGVLSVGPDFECSFGGTTRSVSCLPTFTCSITSEPPRPAPISTLTSPTRTTSPVNKNIANVTSPKFDSTSPPSPPSSIFYVPCPCCSQCSNLPAALITINITPAGALTLGILLIAAIIIWGALRLVTNSVNLMVLREGGFLTDRVLNEGRRGSGGTLERGLRVGNSGPRNEEEVPQ